MPRSYIQFDGSVVECREDGVYLDGVAIALGGPNEEIRVIFDGQGNYSVLRQYTKLVVIDDVKDLTDA